MKKIKNILNILIILSIIIFSIGSCIFMAIISIKNDRSRILSDLFKNDCQASKMYYYTEECLDDLDYCKIAIEECKNIYYYGDTLYAFIWNGKEYIEYLGTYDCVSEGSKYSKVELAYNIGKWHDDMDLFTDKGD